MRAKGERFWDRKSVFLRWLWKVALIDMEKYTSKSQTNTTKPTQMCYYLKPISSQKGKLLKSI